MKYDDETTEFYAWFDSDQNNIGTVDVIGDMWTEPTLSDVFNEDGTRDVITESQKISGYHVNITTDLDLPPNLTNYLIYPETPKRLTNFATKLKYVDYNLEVASLEEP